MKYRIGIDTGGTFTDVVLFGEDEKKIYITKTHSTPDNPALAVINGINKIAEIVKVDTKDIDFLVHGTTVATNALLEYKGVESAILLTEGFKDVLSIARQTRPKLYDWFEKRPEPFIPRHLRYEISERVLYNGEIIQHLDEEQIKQIAVELKNKNIHNIAVCLLHSYANPDNEQKIRDIILKVFPEAKICLSSDILREIREYERMSTTVINAYVMPIIDKYVTYLKGRMKVLQIKAELNIMQSNGGLMTAETAAKKSINTILSGPAGGVIGCVAIAKQIGIDNFITIDMGGTSFDISLAYNKSLSFKNESEIAGHPINVPMIDIHTIGSGGGSIAWIDNGGALRVGPKSAGAKPGPACYGKGGLEPTVTDANLILGRLNHKYYLGGEVSVDVDAAKKAIKEKIADPFNISVEDAAEGIIKVVNAAMIRGIRKVSVEKGYDPREFSIICFGGAGPLHAVELARELNIREVVVPLYPGANSAMGLLTADFRYDYSRTYLSKLNDMNLGILNNEYKDMEQRAIEQFEKENIAGSSMMLVRSVDMRYSGQAYQLNVLVPGGILTKESLELVKNRFHSQHKALYGYDRSEHGTEFVYLRLSSIAQLEKPELTKLPLSEKGSSFALKGCRKVYHNDSYKDFSVYERNKLEPGNCFNGPAIIEQFDTTIFIEPEKYVYMDEYKNIRIKI